MNARLKVMTVVGTRPEIIRLARVMNALDNSDVIEHVLDPDSLLDFIESCKPKFIVFSTPDRDLICGHDHFGPPSNACHVREWNFLEFKQYISNRFEIIEHKITNVEQSTQMVIVKL